MPNLSLDVPGQHLFVRAVGADGIRVGDRWFTASLILTLEQAYEDWPPRTVPDIEPGHLETLLQLEPELVLLGTGPRQDFLEPARLAPFYRQQMGFEIMSTAAACKTFNVLAGDGRKVVAALLPLNP